MKTVAPVQTLGRTTLVPAVLDLKELIVRQVNRHNMLLKYSLYALRKYRSHSFISRLRAEPEKESLLIMFFSTLANTRPRKSCDQHNFLVALLRCISKVFQKAQTCEIKPLSDLS